jgi:Zn-dependent peptidase ImmA (M78 family)
MLDSAAWLLFCETDRIQLLARCTSVSVRPADVLDDIIEDVLGLGLVTRPMPTRILGHCNYDRSCIAINSRMPELVRPNTDLEGLVHSTKAHELGHVRIPHHEAEVRAAYRQGRPLAPEVAARHEAEADCYASVFLVPTMGLWSMPAVSALLDAQSHSHCMASDELWRTVVDLSRAFGVTGSLMARRLRSLGLVEMQPDRQLRLAVPYSA